LFLPYSFLVKGDWGGSGRPLATPLVNDS